MDGIDGDEEKLVDNDEEGGRDEDEAFDSDGGEGSAHIEAGYDVV